MTTFGWGRASTTREFAGLGSSSVSTRRGGCVEICNSANELPRFEDTGDVPHTYRARTPKLII